jgi:hypothetical protein
MYLIYYLPAPSLLPIAPVLCFDRGPGSLRGLQPLKFLTMYTVPAHSNKRKTLLFIALLVVAGLVGFGLGALLWEGGPIHPTPPLRGGAGEPYCMDEQHNVTGVC